MTALPADGLGLPFLEGVALHPVRNVAKMSAGHALDDMDRKPWLHTLADRIRESAESGRGLVVACSALKRRYRDELRSAATEVGCLYLAVNRDIVRGRVAGRAGHFISCPPGWSTRSSTNLEPLEPLEPDEPGGTIDATEDLQVTLSRARDAVGDLRRPYSVLRRRAQDATHRVDQRPLPDEVPLDAVSGAYELE
ncbi:gluconokinase [Streptomyces sp. NBC_01373]|uniref:gluconokinase n=1 Tax=Streptomyces sp. NBC_01373 TaxID=2903843 RepID=UPI002253DCE6|nr:gluconokinase [Streptomyces sp. NBC_01373]MCX4706763.1 gluconokinase [Streptomyces sp. NBC_01373]